MVAKCCQIWRYVYTCNIIWNCHHFDNMCINAIVYQNISQSENMCICICTIFSYQAYIISYLIICMLVTCTVCQTNSPYYQLYFMKISVIIIIFIFWQELSLLGWHILNIMLLEHQPTQNTYFCKTMHSLGLNDYKSYYNCNNVKHICPL